ncbi:MAG: MGMT family protein [Acidobacteria bacterium]|nr:MGMT family protein [Acidobacteriota bacterium]
MNDAPAVISVLAREADGMGFAVAFVGERLVATAVASTRSEVLRFVERRLPRDASRKAVEGGSPFGDRVIGMLRELEAGHEENKAFSLATELLAEPLPAVLTTAAAIPMGYVTSYGNIARASGTEARVVGRIMATNPLYPVVPCHRVVGADLSLVGYRGRTEGPDLDAKLARLRGEARSWPREKVVPLDGGSLLVYPVERVLDSAEWSGPHATRQRKLFE